MPITTRNTPPPNIHGSDPRPTGRPGGVVPKKKIRQLKGMQ
jgi:hypothetical protein